MPRHKKEGDAEAVGASRIKYKPWVRRLDSECGIRISAGSLPGVFQDVADEIIAELTARTKLVIPARSHDLLKTGIINILANRDPRLAEPMPGEFSKLRRGIEKLSNTETKLKNQILLLEKLAPDYFKTSYDRSIWKEGAPRQSFEVLRIGLQQLQDVAKHLQKDLRDRGAAAKKSRREYLAGVTIANLYRQVFGRPAGVVRGHQGNGVSGRFISFATYLEHGTNHIEAPCMKAEAIDSALRRHKAARQQEWAAVSGKK